ncbi:MAG: PqqD family protein [Acidobacteriota bacterium]
MIGPEARPRRRERVLVQRAADQQILLDVDSGNYYALDEVSGRIWELCDGDHSVAAMVEAIRREYEAPAGDPADIEADVLAFLGELADERLVTA